MRTQTEGRVAVALVILGLLIGAGRMIAQAAITLDQVLAVPVRVPDRVIRYGSAPEQFANLRLPKRPGPHPVVVFVHGGCWLSQYDVRHAAPLEQAFADAGYAVWSLEYRRIGSPGGGWPGTFTDIARGADHLRVIAAENSLDLSRVVVAGHSAGGYFALWLAARSKIRRARSCTRPTRFASAACWHWRRRRTSKDCMPRRPAAMPLTV